MIRQSPTIPHTPDTNGHFPKAGTSDIRTPESGEPDNYPDQGETERGETHPAKTVASRRRNIRGRKRRPTIFRNVGDLRETLHTVGDGARVFLVGPTPRARDLVQLVGELGGDARVFLDGHHPVVSIGDTRATWAASWFGDGPFDVDDCRDVWQLVDYLIASAWRGNDTELFLTPATTGRDLWVRTIPSGDGYRVLDHVTQSTIRAGSGQGRIETMPGAGLVTLHEYDARLAYLSVTRRMPVGRPVDLHDADAERWIADHPFAPARLLVSWYVPDGWGSTRPGILPVAMSRTDDPVAGWAWPTDAQRLHGPGWVDATEYALAIRYGWRVSVHRVIGWADTADVFAPWQRRLMSVLDAGARAYADDPRRAAMFRSAVRAIALHTIGAMNGSPHKVTHIGDVPAADAEGIRAIGVGRWAWHTTEPAAWPELSHPEWTATIWGRARARLLDAPNPDERGGRVGALHLPPGAVVAFRTDAIYTTSPTGWADDGKIGRYRLKGVHGPVPWPRTGLDVLAAKGAR